MSSPPEHLDHIKLLAPLPAAERVRIARQCLWRQFVADEQIIDRSTDSRDVCLVAQGRVRIVNFSVSGREISFDEIEAGEHFGELSALDGLPRSAAAVALTPCLVGFLTPRLFQDIAIGYPDLALMVMRRMAMIIRRSTERIMDLSTLGANNRIHAELLRLARCPGGNDGNRAEIKPFPVHGDIAARVSTTRETVARVLSDMTRSGIVERRGGSLVIRDYGRLTAMVEEFRGD